MAGPSQRVGSFVVLSLLTAWLSARRTPQASRSPRYPPDQAVEGPPRSRAGRPPSQRQEQVQFVSADASVDSSGARNSSTKFRGPADPAPFAVRDLLRSRN